MPTSYRSLWIIYINYVFYVCARSSEGCLFPYPDKFDSMVDAEMWIDEMANAALAA